LYFFVLVFFCDMNSPLTRLRLVQRFCPITLVCRCERFLTAPLRVPRPYPSPLRILRVDRGGLTPGVTQRFPVRSSESLVILATIFFLVADQIMRLGIGYLLGINS
jgi:hypothetical protein